MKDRDFLVWLHNRMRFTHDEHPQMDYMLRLRSIIMATPPDKTTPNTNPSVACLSDLPK